MKLFVEPISDRWQAKARAEQLKRAIKEFGLKATSSDGQSFSVEFPEHANPALVEQFIECVSPKGIQIQQNDVHALTEPNAAVRRIVADGLKSGALESEILPDSLGTTLESWRAQIDATPITAEQYEAYTPKPEDFYLPEGSRPVGNDFDDQIAELDAELERLEKAGADTRHTSAWAVR